MDVKAWISGFCWDLQAKKDVNSKTEKRKGLILIGFMKWVLLFFVNGEEDEEETCGEERQRGEEREDCCLYSHC